MQHTTWPVVPALEPITFELLTDVAGGCHPKPCPPPAPAPAPAIQQMQIVQQAPQYIPFPQYIPVPQYMPRRERAFAETTVEVGTATA